MVRHQQKSDKIAVAVQRSCLTLFYGNRLFYIECIYFILSVHGGMNMKYMTSHYSDNGAASCHFVIPITMLLDRINVTALQQYMQQ
jgi:hypothetical protein